VTVLERVDAAREDFERGTYLAKRGNSLLLERLYPYYRNNSALYTGKIQNGGPL
jgi:hypothetical protein